MAILDDDTIGELRLIMEDDLPKLIDSYLNNSTKLIRELQGMAGSVQQDDFVIRIHSLKGSCRNIGALQMGDLCERMEKHARAGNFSKIKQDLEKLNSEFDLVRSALLAVD